MKIAQHLMVVVTVGDQGPTCASQCTRATVATITDVPDGEERVVTPNALPVASKATMTRSVCLVEITPEKAVVFSIAALRNSSKKSTKLPLTNTRKDRRASNNAPTIWLCKLDDALRIADTVLW